MSEPIAIKAIFMILAVIFAVMVAVAAGLLTWLSKAYVRPTDPLHGGPCLFGHLPANGQRPGIVDLPEFFLLSPLNRKRKR